VTFNVERHSPCRRPAPRECAPVRDQVTRQWLRTTGWGAFFLFDATIASPGAASTAWSFARTLAPGSYGIDVRAVSTGGVTETTRPWVVFTVR
jgi:hypothetical protein